MKKIAIVSTMLMGLALASCDSYLDINTNPSTPSESNITSSIEMPGGEMDLVDTYGEYYRIVGGYYTEHFAQNFGTSNYLDYSRFTQSATRSNSAYLQLMQGAIKTFTSVKERAKADADWGSYIAATVLRCYAYQALVDAYGMAPYTEALQGMANTTPKWDEGKDIYAALVGELDTALSKATPASPVCTNLLYNGESAEPWIKFANALKLRILTRESGAVDVNSQIGALIEENNFPTEDVAYQGIWKDESGQMSPYYAEEYSSKWGSTQVNVVANIAIVGTMKTEEYTDPRLAAWVNPNNGGNIVGGVSGSNFSTSSAYKEAYWCRPKASYDMPVYLMSLADIDFYIAEYYAKNGNSAKATEYYNDAIRASFKNAGVDGAEENIAKYPFDSSNYKKSLGIAKWVASFGTDDFEGYCEMRRLGYPTFGNVKGMDIYNNASDDSYDPSKYEPGTLYTPIQVYGQVGDNKLLERWPFPESSSSRNTNCPKFDNSDYTKPIFWATK